MKQNTRIQLENILIGALCALSLVLFVLSFLPGLGLANRVSVFLEMGHMVQRAFSVVLFILTFQLKKRKRAAWNIAVILLFLSFLRGLTSLSAPLYLPFHIAEAVLFLLLLYFRKDFCCPSDRRSLGKCLLFLGLSLVGVVVNAGISYHFSVKPLGETTIASLGDSFLQGTAMIFGMGNPLDVSRGTHVFELVMFWFSWGCILASILYAVRPWLMRPASHASDLQHARTLLNLYSQNPSAYLTLEDDKFLYFGQKVDGVIPYGVVGSTIMVNGDPICADDDFPALLAEFKEFCQRSTHNLFFISVTDHFLEEYKRQGFGWVKNGEEARFHLSNYEISGKKGAKMRMNINHARKAGVVVHEYRPLENRDLEIEANLDRITNEWLQQKKSSMLTFVMGTVGLDNPMDKRYFYATNADGKIVAFIVFVPFLGKNGYMADVTRHGTDAPSGVMETIIYDAFQVFKEEGIEYGSLGVAPLAGLENDSSNPVEKLLRFAYDHLNDCYGFRDLYRAKEKYSPTEWVPSYYVYLPKILTPDMFYALVTIQNPHQIQEAARDILHGWGQRFKNHHSSPKNSAPDHSKDGAKEIGKKGAEKEETGKKETGKKEAEKKEAGKKEAGSEATQNDAVGNEAVGNEAVGSSEKPKKLEKPEKTEKTTAEKDA